jgi:hypothetical protein
MVFAFPTIGSLLRMLPSSLQIIKSYTCLSATLDIVKSLGGGGEEVSNYLFGALPRCMLLPSESFPLQSSKNSWCGK